MPYGRIEVDALHLAAQPLALGEAGHDLQAVAEDHAVGPVLVVLIEVGLVGVLGDAVEVGEQVERHLPRFVFHGLAFLGFCRSSSSISAFGCTFSWM